jgi:hypothetical protein
MGWVLKGLAALVALASLGFGVWPVFLPVAVYLLLSFRRGARRGPERQGLRYSKCPRRHHIFGGMLVALSLVALMAGGTLSPVLLFAGGVITLLWAPRLGGLSMVVVPVRESILLRSRFFPWKWYALAEVKPESEYSMRGAAPSDGRLLVFTGRGPAAFEVLGVRALRYGTAEDKVVRFLRRETMSLSHKGVHLLPLDGEDASKMLSLNLEKLGGGTGNFVPSLPFDVLSLRSKEGLVVGLRAFRVRGDSRVTKIPPADAPPVRRPLVVEAVQKIGEEQGWPTADDFVPFLAALDASRSEPFADRVRTKGEISGRVAVEAAGGAEVRLTKAQLGAVGRIYT